MQSQRGNIIVYLVVGLVLCGAFLTGLWWVKRQSTPVAVVSTTSRAGDKAASTETRINQDDSGTKSAAGTDSTTEQGTSADFPQQTSSTSTTQPSLAPESQTPPTGASHSDGVANTGPAEDAFLTALVMGVLTYLGTHFVRSRTAPYRA